MANRTQGHRGLAVHSSESEDEQVVWMEGRISVEAAILGRRRPLEEVYLLQRRRSRSANQLKRLAQSRGIPITLKDEAFFEETAQGTSHGGILARVGPRTFDDPRDLVEGHAYPVVVMLDGIEDPFNFGQAVRALYAAGIAGLVVRPRSWFSAAPVITRASAGASELLPTAVLESPMEAAKIFRQLGLAVACTARNSAVSIYAADLTTPMFLLIGGEKRGITRSFLDQADVRLEIPYGRAFNNSLGAAASTAVIAFEILRQRTVASLTSPDAT